MSFKDKHILITAGPTYEPIDPVRYLGNFSSGKMGYALAQVFSEKGARVTLVSGPVQLDGNIKGVKVVSVTTAEEMYRACLNMFSSVDIAVMAAAVADYTPVHVAKEKIKKQDEELKIVLKKTKDIAKSLGELKKEHQILVGFALETENEQENAIKKRATKNMDMIVLNSLNDKGAGFQNDTNKISIIDRNNIIHNFELKSKYEVAKDIVDFIEEII